MNNEKYNQIINEVYQTYWDENSNAETSFMYEGSLIEVRRMTKDEFINMVKTDALIAERWGLKIEERELSLKERLDHFEEFFDCTPNSENMSEAEIHNELSKSNVPTRAVTVTYNNETIEVYEQRNNVI